MASAIKIGASKKAISAAQAAITQILEGSTREEKTIRVALGVFEKVCAVSHVSITDCKFTVGDPSDGDGVSGDNSL